jgi:hypothetical protein
MHDDFLDNGFLSAHRVNGDEVFLTGLKHFEGERSLKPMQGKGNTPSVQNEPNPDISIN